VSRSPPHGCGPTTSGGATSEKTGQEKEFPKGNASSRAFQTGNEGQGDDFSTHAAACHRRHPRSPGFFQADCGQKILPWLVESRFSDAISPRNALELVGILPEQCSKDTRAGLIPTPPRLFSEPNIVTIRRLTNQPYPRQTSTPSASVCPLLRKPVPQSLDCGLLHLLQRHHQDYFSGQAHAEVNPAGACSPRPAKAIPAVARQFHQGQVRQSRRRTVPPNGRIRSGKRYLQHAAH
jgi:hypothetical protein